MPSIRLSVEGLGHVPSMKNSKLWTGKKLVTKPASQKWMERAIQSLRFQLLCACPTGGVVMLMVPSLQSWIVSSLPLDDSVDWIPEISVRVEVVPPGKEGAEVVIEPIL